MNLFKFLIALSLSLCGAIYGENTPIADKQIPEKKFVIVTPSYNNKDYYKKNLDSIFAQKYNNYRVIYVDDVSTDGTGPLVQAYIKEKGQENRVTFIQNKERILSLANLYNMIHSVDKGDIVIMVDGDDFLYHDQVLAHLNKVYADPDVWMTYGQFIVIPGNTVGWCAPIPKEVIEKNAFRSNSCPVSHPRTFYAGLFQKIKKEDMMYEGEFFQAAGDTAYMMPMLEMSGFHTRFVPEVLYEYNHGSPINDDKVRFELQRKLSNLAREKTKYQPLEKLN